MEVPPSRHFTGSSYGWRNVPTMASIDGKPRTTHIAVEAVAMCPFSMAEAYAADYLRAAELHGPESEMGVPWLPLPALRHKVMLAFGIHTDLLDHGRRHDELHISWHLSLIHI